MRSKEVDEAITDLKLQIKKEKEELPYSEECLKNKETILSYIEELEKRDKAVLVHFDKEGNPIEYINKQVIRDKIALYKLKIEDLKILYPNTYPDNIGYYAIKIQALKEIIGE